MDYFRICIFDFCRIFEETHVDTRMVFCQTMCRAMDQGAPCTLESQQTNFFFTETAFLGRHISYTNLIKKKFFKLIYGLYYFSAYIFIYKGSY
jgi:hypothetical protein